MSLTRVTRLGEFSPIGSFLKTTSVAKNICATFVHCENYIFILTKNGLGYIFGDFVTN
jgi:hypothetical protein